MLYAYITNEIFKRKIFKEGGVWGGGLFPPHLKKRTKKHASKKGKNELECNRELLSARIGITASSATAPCEATQRTLILETSSFISTFYLTM